MATAGIGHRYRQAQRRIDDLIRLVNTALGGEALSACASGDTNGDDAITIEEIIGAVNRAMSGCPAPARNFTWAKA